MSKSITLEQLHDPLPSQLWYLSSDTRDLYCRVPYSFMFSTSEAAVEFAREFGVEDVNAVGVTTSELEAAALIAAFRSMRVTRVFIDPQIDPDTGDVFGTILRLAEPN